MPSSPLPATQAWLWKWEALLPLAQRAGEVVPVEKGGDRRALLLVNPGLGGLPFTSTTLQGALQYLGPGEIAPAHRHTPAAIRFVMQGSGAYTTVDGDACDMLPGDLVLTDSWCWHDHTNEGEESVVWFDGLDLPLVARVESVMFESYSQQIQPIEARNRSENLFSAVGLREVGEMQVAAPGRLLRYPWAETERGLEALHDARGRVMTSLESDDRWVVGGHFCVRDTSHPARFTHAPAAQDRQHDLRRVPRERPVMDRQPAI
jgi:gentisate 1,2-dioxygenase